MSIWLEIPWYLTYDDWDDIDHAWYLDEAVIEWCNANLGYVPVLEVIHKSTWNDSETELSSEMCAKVALRSENDLIFFKVRWI